MSDTITPSEFIRSTTVDQPEHLLWRKVNLVYLVFVFVPMLMNPEQRTDTTIWLATLLSIAVFMPIYWRSYDVGPAGVLPMASAMAAIGCALSLVSFGGNTFIIYAMATAGHASTPRRAILFSLGVALAYSVVLAYVGLPLKLLVVVMVIGSVVMLGAIFSRMQSLRNAELRLTQEEVKRLAQMTERERIGRDLHDLLGHTLTLIAIKSELAGKLMGRDTVAAEIQIHEIESIARKALGEVREAVSGIRASGFDAELASARLSLLSAGVSLDARVPALPKLASEIESALALGLREAVTNVVRHAGADRVEVELQTDRQSLALSISDDGRGMTKQAGNGLTGMRERIEHLGGRMTVDSSPAAGTRIRIWLPTPSAIPA